LRKDAAVALAAVDARARASEMRARDAHALRPRVREVESVRCEEDDAAAHAATMRSLDASGESAEVCDARVARAIDGGSGDGGRESALEMRMSAEQRAAVDREAWREWERFYMLHRRTGFYKDRHHLREAFSELMPPEVRSNPRAWCAPLPRAPPERRGDAPQAQQRPQNEWLENKQLVLELGCGVGSAVWPLLRANPRLFVFACDYAPASVALMRAHDEYDAAQVFAFRADITRESSASAQFNALSAENALESVIERGSVHFATAVWVLSALEPAHVRVVARKLYQLLAPGGLVFVRDYARGDLSELRLCGAPGARIDTDFFRCGDGTRRHFFTLARLKAAFESVGFVTQDSQLVRREITNRKAQLHMHRTWVQAKFHRPSNPA